MLNSRFNIYRNEWLELVFTGRNHEYGAYVLRRDYEKTLAKALFFTVAALAVFLFLLQWKIPPSAPVETNDITPQPADKTLKITAVELLPKKHEVPPAQTVKSGVLEKIETKRFAAPRVVPAAQAFEIMPAIEELENAVIGQVDIEGEETGLNNLSAETSGEGIGGSREAENAGDNVFSFELIEKYPEFPGGMNAFAKFLQKNLRYPPSALENGISGRVTVSFIVEKDGRLTDIRILRGIGFGCDEEAVRVLKKSPLWTPGVQNKQKVRVQYVVPVVFRAE